MREVEVCDSAHYLGPRKYRIGARIVAAGLQERAIMHPDGAYRQEVVPSLETQLRDPSTGEVEVREVQYRME
jgi:hypothetical protein